MPWDTVEEAEKKVPGIKGYSAKAKRAWLSAFNSCYKDKGDSGSCYAIAHGAAKKVDGKKEGSMGRYAAIAERLAAKLPHSRADEAYNTGAQKARDADYGVGDYVSPVRGGESGLVVGFDRDGSFVVVRVGGGRYRSFHNSDMKLVEIQGGRRLAVSLLQEAKAAKLKARAVEFFQEVKQFRGELNDFISDLTGAVSNPQALRGFPEMRDVLELNAQLRKGLLRHTFLTEKDIEARMEQVVALDV